MAYRSASLTLMLKPPVSHLLAAVLSRTLAIRQNASTRLPGAMCRGSIATANAKVAPVSVWPMNASCSLALMSARASSWRLTVVKLAKL